MVIEGSLWSWIEGGILECQVNCMGKRCGKKDAWLGINSRVISGGELAIETESVFGMTFGLKGGWLRESFPGSILLRDTRICWFMSCSEIIRGRGKRNAMWTLREISMIEKLMIMRLSSIESLSLQVTEVTTNQFGDSTPEGIFWSDSFIIVWLKMMPRIPVFFFGKSERLILCQKLLSLHGKQVASVSYHWQVDKEGENIGEQMFSMHEGDTYPLSCPLVYKLWTLAG